MDAPTAKPAQTEAECRALSRYLVGIPATDRLQRDYAAFCRARAGKRPLRGAFDHLSLALLAVGPLAVGLVDAYVSRMQRGGPAFERLVGMLALLECLPEGSAVLDRPDRGGAAWIVTRLAGRALLDALALGVGILLLGPVHLFQRVRARGAA